MRRTMTKEVTKTTVKIARMVVEDGFPKAEPLEDEVLLGNVAKEKAQKAVTKKYGEGVTVFGVQADTLIYEMPVEEFIKYASIKEDAEEATEVAE